MRLATYNILNGRSPHDGVVDPARFAAAVAALDADVLGLQEVDRDQPRTQRADLTAVAAEAMGAMAYRFVPALQGTPGGLWVPAYGDVPGAPCFGISLLSRYPVVSWQTIRLPWIGVGFPLPLPGAGPGGRRRGVMVREEPRVAVVARLDTPFGPRAVVNTHLTYIPGWSRRQLRALRTGLADLTEPLVLMGDFNMIGSQPAAITGYRSLGHHKTFPAGTPRVQLDHILARGAWGAVTQSRALHLEVSDHRALLVELADPAD